MGAWGVLVLAGLLEVVWALGLKWTEGFTRLTPSVVVGAAMVASMYLLAKAVQTIPVGTAYAVWVGIGVLGTVVGDAVLRGEMLAPLRLLYALAILGGIVGLKMTATP